LEDDAKRIQINYDWMRLRPVILFITAILTHAAIGQNIVTGRLQINHVIKAVDNMDNGKIEYERYSCKVVSGRTKKQALNALIFLIDGILNEHLDKNQMPHKFILSKGKISNQ